MTTGTYHFQRRREQRPPGRGFEFYAWFFMRVSGGVLLGLAVFTAFDWLRTEKVWDLSHTHK